MLFLDGVYVTGTKGASTGFHRDNEPTSGEPTQLAHTLAHRVGHYLERQGWLERDAENGYPAPDNADDDPLICANKPELFPSLSSIVNFLAETVMRIFADSAKTYRK